MLACEKSKTKKNQKIIAETKAERAQGMKLGAAYNLFDAEELLEASILSIRENVEFICVVYQTVSNWGNTCSPHLPELLEDLRSRGLIDQLVFYEPKKYTLQERQQLTSSKAAATEIGGSLENVANQFYDEISKREIGLKNFSVSSLQRAAQCAPHVARVARVVLSVQVD